MRTLGRNSDIGSKWVRRDNGDAFFPEPGTGPALVPDDLAKELAEYFLVSVTTGQEQAGDVYNQIVEEELGGPFVPTTSRREFARGADDLGSDDGEPEAFPTPGPTSSDAFVDEEE